MDRFEIHGGNRLEGKLTIKGSKNATLPLMAAALLTDEPVILRHVPDLADIGNMRRLLDNLSCLLDWQPLEDLNSAGGTLRIHADPAGNSHAHYDIVRTMRASICVLGPMLARRGKARVSLPGGCAIGERPVDLHLHGLKALGAEITRDGGDIIASIPDVAGRPGRLKGARIFLGGPFGSTVLGTANVMSAACLAEGTTIIECAACEPEIVDLAKMLTAMGAQIYRTGPTANITGVKKLTGTQVMASDLRASACLVLAGLAAEGMTTVNRVYHLDRGYERMEERLRTLGARIQRVSETVPEPLPG